MRRALTVASALVVLAACGSDTGSGTDGGSDRLAPYDAADDPSVYDSTLQLSTWDQPEPDHFNAQLELPDGRRVAFHYAVERGLAEQHYSPEADAWTAPEIIYETDQDPCQGISIVADGGTVAVTADWALYCYDGEPPTESLAGVGTGDLTEWDLDLTEGFDGWEPPTVSDEGATVTWAYHSNRLTWTPDGFEKSL